MAVLVGVFEAQEAAERAFVRLRDVGVPDEDLALIANAVHAGPATNAADLAAQHEAAVADRMYVELVVARESGRTASARWAGRFHGNFPKRVPHSAA